MLTPPIATATISRLNSLLGPSLACTHTGQTVTQNATTTCTSPRWLLTL